MMSTRSPFAVYPKPLYRRGDQVVALESVHAPHGESVGLQRLSREVDLVMQRGLGRRSVRLVGGIQLLAEAPRRIAADRRVRVVRGQLPHNRGRALAGVVWVGLSLADVPDRVRDAR